MIHRQKPLSASSIKKFIHCPRQFKYYKENVPSNVVGSNLILGSAGHEALDRYWKGEYDHSTAVKKASSWYQYYYAEYKKQNKIIQHYGYSGWKKDQAELEMMVDGYIKEFGNIKPLASEYSMLFNFPMANTFPQPIEVHNDLLYFDDDGKLCICDYKTGKSDPTETYMAFDLQLSIYLYALLYGWGIKGRADYARTEPLPEIEEWRKRGAPFKKIIYNIRGYTYKEPRQVLFENESFDENIFKKDLQYYLSLMDVCHNGDHWPRNCASIHDSPCAFCEYKQHCVNDKK